MKTRGLVACAVLLVGSLFAAGPDASAAVTWTKVANGTLSGFSGLAPASTGWVAVRDNKSAGQNRIALLSAGYGVTPLTWPGTQPQDLEALDAVPGQSGQFVAMTSAGRASVLSINGSTVRVLRTVTVPRATANMEAFAMARVGSTTIAVWGNRGSTTAVAKIFAATFNPATGVFGTVVAGQVKVPYPTSDVRQVSDLKIVGGRVIVSSASDPGDSGPFASAMYDAGSVTASGGRAALTLTTPRSLGTYPDHKIEGIACSGAAGLLATDDEKQGGSVTPDPFCSVGSTPAR